MTNTASTSVTWAPAVQRRHTPLMLSFSISGQALECIQKHAGLAVEFPHLRRSGIEFQFTQEEIAAARSKIHREVMDSGLNFFNKFSRRCLTTSEALLRTAATVGAKPLPQPDDGPAFETLLRPYFAAAVAQASLLMTMILVQFELEAFLEEFVTTRITSDDRRKGEVLAALKIAIEPTQEVLNLVSLLELGEAIQSQVEDYTDWITADPAHLLVRIATEYPAIWEGVRKYEKDFGWMGRMYFAGNPISAGDIVLRLQNILRYDCGERLAELSERREAQLAERAKAIEDLDDSQAQPLADTIAHYMHLRSERLDAFFVAHERVLDALGAAAQALELSRPDDIIYLDWREITHALRAGADTAELRASANARRIGFEFSATDGVTEWTAPTASTQASATQPPSSVDDMIVGVTACAGHTTGRVRLILSDQDMLDMAPGEILVTTMTTPSLMLAVEKAAGIVTDEGGMLCHAAIVSREFNIPCVIGTKDATRRLQNGDTVVMTADEGKVQITSRAAPSAGNGYANTNC
jgi:phosphohistidine swiveling domain-containing protein